MKSIFVFALLVSVSAVCFSQCDATISPSDTVGTVKAKLACFVKMQTESVAEREALRAELTKMKEQNGELKSENARLDAENKKLSENPPLAFNWTPGTSDSSKFTVAECKGNASRIILKRGGKLTGEGNTWMGFLIGKELITIECGTTRSGYVFIVSPSDHANDTLGKLLADAIFP